ncbi:MAG: hypothetical protein OES79_11265 [Planctomycetota bacterium]|nr:hypothetical protein [Planctomycetota bacterium]
MMAAAPITSGIASRARPPAAFSTLPPVALLWFLPRTVCWAAISRTPSVAAVGAVPADQSRIGAAAPWARNRKVPPFSCLKGEVALRVGLHGERNAVEAAQLNLRAR